jgi:hypothetical protein
MLPNQYLGRNVAQKNFNFFPEIWRIYNPKKHREYAIKMFLIFTFVDNFVPNIGWFEDNSMLNNSMIPAGISLT